MNLILKQNVPVISFQFLQACLENQRVLPYQPFYLAPPPKKKTETLIDVAVDDDVAVKDDETQEDKSEDEQDQEAQEIVGDTSTQKE